MLLKLTLRRIPTGTGATRRIDALSRTNPPFGMLAGETRRHRPYIRTAIGFVPVKSREIGAVFTSFVERLTNRLGLFEA
jgi:hypothetical protein